MAKRASFNSVVDRLKGGTLSKRDAQVLLNAFATWADARLPNDEWDEVVSLERSLFGKTLEEKKADDPLTLITPTPY